MRLIITRHAKSSWSDPLLRDHDRPLSGRGKRSSELIGQWLSCNGHAPGHVMCSSARRTQDTWRGISAIVGKPELVEILPELYHAGPGEMTRTALRARHSPAMIIGHNPGIGGFAEWICAEPPDHPDFMRFPTGATLVCDMDERVWRTAMHRAGTVLAFTVPRELG